NAGEPNEWTKFELPFVMKKGKTIDKEKLKNNKYSIAIVFTSSIEGAYFRGAIGSTLYIDEVELVYNKD
ncbi:MAG: PCMD domain-containing protein, partial [Bacteroidaceae bacterium]